MAKRYELRRLRKVAGLTVGESICDIGCAYGPNPYLKARKVVGLDLQDMELRAPYTEHIVGDVFSSSELLRGVVFDTIVLGEFIEHVERPYDLLRILREYLAPGGRLILSTPNPLGVPPVLMEYLLIRRFFYGANHVYYFPPRWVWRLLERSGYSILKTVGCGISLLGLWLPAPTSLSYQVIYVATPA